MMTASIALHRLLRANLPLGGFFLLSVVLHLALLAAWVQPLTVISRPDATLSIRLLTHHGPSAAARAQPDSAVPAVPIERDTAAARIERAARHGEARLRSTTTSAEELPGDLPRSAEERDSARDHWRDSVTTRIRSQLLSELARYFVYPEIARQHGWQGAVLLGFQVLADGRLDGIHVARSSGYHVLDRSAENALRRVERVAEADQWLRGHALNMEMPVIYRLLDQ